MATEPFLINPFRVGRRRRRVVLDDNPKGLPPALLSRMIRTYGPRRGMREAWRLYRMGITKNEPEFNPWETFTIPERSLRIWRDPKTGRFAIPPRRKNLGEEVILMNPRRRRRRVRRRRYVLDNAWFGDPAGHRAAALKGWRTRRRLRDNPLGEEVMVIGNPRRRRRRRIRRRVRLFGNPRRARATALPAISVSRPASLIMPALVGTAAYVATDKVPSMVNVTSDLPRLGVKAAVGFGGGILLSRIAGSKAGVVWAIGSSINLMTDILRTYVFKGTLSGLGAFPRRGLTYRAGAPLGAYPTEYQFSNYPM